MCRVFQHPELIAAALYHTALLSSSLLASLPILFNVEACVEGFPSIPHVGSKVEQIFIFSDKKFTEHLQHVIDAYFLIHISGYIFPC